MNKVKKEESESPKMTAPPKDVQVSLESVIGKIPKIVQIEVMKMASILDLPASITESMKWIPLFMFKFILSTKIIAFLTTIPNSAKIPTSPGKLKATLNIPMPTKTPIRAKGIVTKTIAAFRKELNWMTKVMIINRIATTIACKIEMTDSVFCSFSPP